MKSTKDVNNHHLLVSTNMEHRSIGFPWINDCLIIATISNLYKYISALNSSLYVNTWTQSEFHFMQSYWKATFCMYWIKYNSNTIVLMMHSRNLLINIILNSSHKPFFLYCFAFTCATFIISVMTNFHWFCGGWHICSLYWLFIKLVYTCQCNSC